MYNLSLFLPSEATLTRCSLDTLFASSVEILQFQHNHNFKTKQGLGLMHQEIRVLSPKNA